VEVPIDPKALWTCMVIWGDLDEAVERMAHKALIAMCEHHLPDTVGSTFQTQWAWPSHRTRSRTRTSQSGDSASRLFATSHKSCSMLGGCNIPTSEMRG
jgi:hypothetical protein